MGISGRGCFTTTNKTREMGIYTNYYAKWCSDLFYTTGMKRSLSDYIKAFEAVKRK